MPTLLKEINISGKALMSGRESTVNLFPSNEKGIRFFVQGCDKPVEATRSMLFQLTTALFWQ